jgi:hypothetical protein
MITLEDNANQLNPLKLAQRKKLCVYHPAMQMNVLNNYFLSAVPEIPRSPRMLIILTLITTSRKLHRLQN